MAKLAPSSIPHTDWQPVDYRFCALEGLIVGRADFDGPYRVIGKPVDPSAGPGAGEDGCPSCSGPLAMAKFPPSAIPATDWEPVEYRFCPAEGLIVGREHAGGHYRVIERPVDPPAAAAPPPPEDTCPSCGSTLAMAKFAPGAIPEVDWTPAEIRLCPREGLVIGRHPVDGNWRVLGPPTGSAPASQPLLQPAGGKECPGCGRPLARAKLRHEAVPEADFQVESYWLCPAEGLVVGEMEGGELRVVGPPAGSRLSC
ncbi:hypothetical protein DFJ74DRAFT_712806 [Hyaloraphidium curvatum]|nr:hypothetical protein DFJ74DRAFT_712806 [Hyaloraphidium curvatum]